MKNNNNYSNSLMGITRTDKFIKVIREMGYTEAPKNGSSHRIFKCNGKPCLSIPNNRELAPGTRRNLVKLICGNEYYS